MRRIAPYPRDRTVARMIEPRDLVRAAALALVTLATIAIYALAPI